jgi:glycine/D-amino acid oxidase-like deaminating enzyme
MDIRSNEPYWLIKNAFENSYPSLQESITTDVLVIGGGITGALITYQLLKEGREVVLIDRRDVCNGSSAASTAMLQYEIDVPLHELIHQRGEATAVRSYKNCEKAIYDLKKIVAEIDSNCHFEIRKSVYFTNDKEGEKMLKKEFHTRQKFGFAVEWLDKKHLKSLGLKARAAIQSESGAVFDPYKFTNDLLRLCAKKEATIYDRSEIKKTRQKDGKMLAITPEKLTIQANHIVHCTGYESVQRLSKKTANLKSTYALASEAFEELPAPFRNHIYWDTASPYHYFRGTSDNRVISGGGDERFKNATKRDALLNKKRDSLTKQFRRFFPDISFKPDYVWAGTFGETEDGLPYLGRPNPEIDEHYVLGFGGNGITYSVMAMDAILDSLNHRDHIFLTDYGFDR